MLSQLAAKIPESVKNDYSRAMENLAKYGSGGTVVGTFPVIVQNGVARVFLPILPDGSTWIPAAAASMKAKIATVGTAGATAIALVGPAGNVASWSLQGGVDSDDTYKNAAAVDQTGLAGGQHLTVNVTSLATGGAGNVTLSLVFTTAVRMDDLFLVP